MSCSRTQNSASCEYSKLLTKVKCRRKHSFRNTIRVSNSLDPDQNRHSIRPDLGLNCLQRLSADDKIAASMESVNIDFWDD